LVTEAKARKKTDLKKKKEKNKKEKAQR